LAVAAVIASACQYVATPSPTAPTASSTSSSGTTSGSTTLTYVKDVQPILASDCVRCHGPSRRDAGVDLSTYANVMQTVVAGNANSLLVLVTQPGGLMYGQFSGSQSTKATTIRDWVVSSHAAQQ
jgi:hypothetical protein